MISAVYEKSYILSYLCLRITCLVITQFILHIFISLIPGKSSMLKTLCEINAKKMLIGSSSLKRIENIIYILHFGKNNPNIEYNMEEKLISASRTMKDLGIIFEDDFKFEEHMSKIINNANSKLGIIKNTFHELTKDNFIILYKAFVRPILEYCCTTWAPHFIKDHKEIEKVQKRATKLVKSISHLPYGERLKKLSLTTLYYRRQRADVLQVFRIIKGIDK